jgi:hypothetical protein
LNSSELQLALQQLPDMARQDLIQSEKAYRKHRIALIDKLQTRTYDKYLKTQGIHEGVKNYSRGILLLSFGWRWVNADPLPHGRGSERKLPV